MTGAWHRYKTMEICPVCGHGGRAGHGSGCCCLGIPENPELVLCLRVSQGSFREARNGAGWIHRMKETAATATPIYRPKPKPQPKDFWPLWQELESKADHARVDASAKRLGLSTATLKAVGIGFDVKSGADAFPMRDGAGRIIGVRFRSPDGSKWSAKESQNGIFIPKVTPGISIYIVEGPTDQGAMIELGFPHTIGRPSNTAGKEFIAEYVRRVFPRPRVTVIPSNDLRGTDASRLTDIGVHSLAGSILPHCFSLSLFVPHFKDIREWYAKGLTKCELLDVMNKEMKAISKLASESNTNSVANCQI